MPMDPDIIGQLNTAHARGVAAAAGVQEMNNNGLAQLGLLIASANAFDNRLMNGFLAAQLFDQNLVQAKAAYHSPVEPGAAPLASPVSK